MSYLPTGSFKIQKKLQRVEEATFGVTPVASPVFTSWGPGVQIQETTEISMQRYRNQGNRDIYTALLLEELYSFALRYQPINTAGIRYGTELPGGTGTIEKALSFLYSQLLADNATEQYTFLKGSRCDKIEIEITKAGVFVVQNFLCREITAWANAHGLTTPTFASADTAKPWVGKDSGANPLTINSNNYDTPRFKVTVQWNMQLITPNGETKAKFIEPTNRDIFVELDTWLKDNVLHQDAKALTARSASYVLNATGPKTLTLGNLYLNRRTNNVNPTANEHQIESFAGTAESISVTA